MSKQSSLRPAWSSAFGFYLATVGASVGLGSIWRFPYLAGSSGGSAFIFVFIAACVLIATPLLTAEFVLGRGSAKSPPEAAGAIALDSGRRTRWNVIGIMGTLGSFLVISYYTVIAGWVMAYTWKCATGLFVGMNHPQVAESWRGFLANPLAMGSWHLAFVACVGLISALGVNRGIELANKVRAPALLILMLILVTYALITGDVRGGLGFAFAPNFSAITPQVILAAIGQAFYATGVGMAMMIAYGAYLNRGVSLVRSSLIISAAILLVSLLSTLIVFPLVFRYGMNPAEGPALVFDVLVTVFGEMPGGRYVGTLFFLLLVFAALTPSLAGIEPMIAWLQQRRGLGRPLAVAITAFSVWLLGVASVLSFNRWSLWYPLGAIPGFRDKTVFASLDYFASNVLLPVGALITSVFVGWVVNRDIVAEQLSEASPAARLLILLLLRYVCPVAIVAVLLASFW